MNLRKYFDDFLVKIKEKKDGLIQEAIRDVYIVACIFSDDYPTEDEKILEPLIKCKNGLTLSVILFLLTALGSIIALIKGYSVKSFLYALTFMLVLSVVFFVNNIKIYKKIQSCAYEHIRGAVIKRNMPLVNKVVILTEKKQEVEVKVDSSIKLKKRHFYDLCVEKDEYGDYEAVYCRHIKRLSKKQYESYQNEDMEG